MLVVDEYGNGYQHSPPLSEEIFVLVRTTTNGKEESWERYINYGQTILRYL